MNVDSPIDLPLEGISIHLGMIEEDNSRQNRREREKAAVASLIENTLGCKKTLQHTPDGAPLIEGIPFVSISHSQKIAGLAISQRHCIGIDIEDWRPALERVKERFLTQAELTWCDDLLLAWTIKEAVYKAANRRALGAKEIIIDPSYLSAKADNKTYNIKTWMRGESRITLAVTE